VKVKNKETGLIVVYEDEDEIYVVYNKEEDRTYIKVQEYVFEDLEGKVDLKECEQVFEKHWKAVLVEVEEWNMFPTPNNPYGANYEI
jgi:hypothetical protein